MVRYGQRVTVIALPSPEIFLTPRGLQHVGPARIRPRYRLPIGIRIVKRIGIDVGGTNTDAVLVNDGRVEGAVKAPTSADVTGGIVAAMRKLRTQTGDVGGRRRHSHWHHAFHQCGVQRKHLNKVAAIRIGAPATTALPPFCDWPADLADLADGGVWAVEGAHDYDGRRFMPLNVAQVRAAAREIRQRGLRYARRHRDVLSAYPSGRGGGSGILREEVPDIAVTCSHLLGGIGLLERENAALLNAALIALARETIKRLRGRDARRRRRGAALHHTERWNSRRRGACD